MTETRWSRDPITGERVFFEVYTQTEVDAIVSALTSPVTNSPLAKASVTGDGNQPNTILTLTSERADAGWSFAGNAATFTGSPNRVRINAMAFYEQPSNSSFQRISPQLELLKNGVVVAISSTGYQRHTTGHDSSSNTIMYIDANPGVNPQYQLRAQQESTQNDVLNVDLGHFDLEAGL